MRKIFDNKHQKKRIIIGPGEYYVTSLDEIIYTVLGSCISVCLIDRNNNLYGMNHFMLPNSAEGISIKNGEMAKYGENAMKLLINRMTARGTRPSSLTAKVFGGGHVINFGGVGAGVPENNINFAINYLKNNGILIESMDLGGNFPRRVMFHTTTGDVHLSYIKKKSLVVV